MKIEAITLREIQMPLVHFFETSFGRTYDRRILLITIHSEGTNGWAESVTGENPGFSSEWIDSTWGTIKSHIASTLLGKTLSAASESPVLMRGIRGHQMAEAASKTPFGMPKRSKNNSLLANSLGEHYLR